jgi:uncharacterized coiled-coil protein SlyX
VNNPFQSASRLAALEQLALGHSSLIGQIVAGLETSVRIDLQHKERLDELEQASASQRERIQALEQTSRDQNGAIDRLHIELRRLADQVSRLQSDAWRHLPLGPRPGAPFQPSPSPLWNVPATISLADLVPNTILDPRAVATMSTTALQAGPAPDEGVTQR